MLELNAGRYRVQFTDDPTFTVGSADNLRQYGAVHQFGLSRDFHTSSGRAVLMFDGVTEVASCILLAVGGATIAHQRSAVIEKDLCIVAVGPFLAALRLPNLEQVWSTRVDEFTCFGVYVSERHQCLISHGELQIARLSFDGEIAWQVAGADIFTNGFTLDDDWVRVRDWNEREYVINLGAQQ